MKPSVDDRIQANKARALTTVRRRAHQAALTGEILPLNVQNQVNRYNREQAANDKPDYQQFEDLRDNASSGVFSAPSATNLVVSNAEVKDSPSTLQRSLRVGDASSSRVSETPSFIGNSKLILAEIPADSVVNSVVRNYDLNYRAHETRDFDYVRVPKEENLLSIDTEDFFEFERVFNCTRQELIHLSKSRPLML